ncbi:hypothetical protein LIER_17582 [Lithospermum erythrorhizon]|uniref:Uncharacterized protein n=1 Tax=Lithospermum erythrorhizon TaxID=34254 RepID=A0AAV3QDE8_LITER
MVVTIKNLQSLASNGMDDSHVPSLNLNNTEVSMVLVNHVCFGGKRKRVVVDSGDLEFEDRPYNKKKAQNRRGLPVWLDL